MRIISLLSPFSHTPLFCSTAGCFDWCPFRFDLRSPVAAALQLAGRAGAGRAAGRGGLRFHRAALDRARARLGGRAGVGDRGAGPATGSVMGRGWGTGNQEEDRGLQHAVTVW